MKNNSPTNIYIHITKLVEPTFDKKGIHLLKLIEDWEKIITNITDVKCIPYKIMWDNNNHGELHIKLNNPILKLELQHNSTEIIEKINTYFGYKCINRIKLV